jgi:hypothetical protein
MPTIGNTKAESRLFFAAGARLLVLVRRVFFFMLRIAKGGWRFCKSQR